MRTPKMLERWKPKTEGMDWQVMGLDKKADVFMLSGPGPCRSVQYVSTKAMMEGWELVREAPERRTQNPHRNPLSGTKDQ